MKTCLQIFKLLMCVLVPFTLFGQEPDSSLITIDRIIGNEFVARTYGPIQWLKDGSGYTLVEDNQIIKYSCETGNHEILIPSWRLIPPGETKSVTLNDYSWSSNGARILFFSNTGFVSYDGCMYPESCGIKGDYWVLDLYLWSWNRICKEAPPRSLSGARFSPDGLKVSFIRDKDLFVEDLTSFKTTQITNSPSAKIFNGRGRGGIGYVWNPDSKSIAYVQTDFTDIPDFYMIDNINSLYPKIISFPYVKVGQKFPSFKVGVVTVAGSETKWIDLPCDQINDYLSGMEWAADDGELLMQILNRRQDTLKVIMADTKWGKLRTILTETDKNWVEPGNISRLEDGKKFTFMSDRDGWKHVYLFSRSGEQLGLLTPGNFAVESIQGIDEKNGWLYYIASPDNPGQRYLWRVPLNMKSKPERITPANQNGTNHYNISPDFRYALHTYSTAELPPIISLITLPDHKFVRILQDNSELKTNFDKIKHTPKEFFRVDIGNGVMLDAWCLKPPDMDPEKKYPLLFYVYGEPAGQTVLDQWVGRRDLWHLMLAQKGYIIMSVDNRGTSNMRGRDFRKSIHGKLGILAPEDQAAAARSIMKERKYVDPKRIGVYGHSGGGQMSLHLIFKFPEIYSLAMPSGFVSNQRYYHPGYQEKFMGQLAENTEAYRLGSPITWAKQLKGNLLIIHGTGDTNVHYQSFEALVNELVANKKRFTMMAYPNRNHGISEGENTQYHLYDLRTNFLMTNMPPGPSK
ncbi:MAG: S9 family peptidase [Odoribacter sp.]|nr:S9 family peptidase [Odoribacter sp.]